MLRNRRRSLRNTFVSRQFLREALDFVALRAGCSGPDGRLVRRTDLRVAERRRIARQDGFNLDRPATVVDKTQLVRRSIGQVDHTICMKRAAIGDANDNGFPVIRTGHPHIGRDRQSRVCRGHREHVVGFAD